MNKKLKCGLMVLSGIFAAGIGIAAIMRIMALFSPKVAASVSIIGGSDGPTSIFLAGKIGSPWTLLIGAFIAMPVILAAVLIIVMIKKRKK